MSNHIERSIDFLEGVEKTNVPLMATFVGFKKSFQARFGIEKFPMVMHDNPRKAVVRAYGSSKYPYGYFRMTELNLNDDRNTFQNIRRFGSGVSIKDLEDALVQKSFMFPTKVNVECKYLDDDPIRVLNFIQKLAIFNSCRLLSFDISLPGSETWNVNVVSNQKGAAIPVPVEDDDDKPTVYEIDFSYELETKIGFEKIVAKINNAGKITTNVELQDAPE